MAIDKEQAEHANGVFIALAKSAQERLANGLKRREEIREQLMKGINPSGYRAAWLDETATRLTELLGQCAREFNEDHTDDMISAHDIGDVIATILHRFEQVCEEDDEDIDSNKG